MKKSLLLAILGCSIIGSAAYANINSLLRHATTADAGTPIHTFEIFYKGHDAVTISNFTLSISDYGNGQCTNTESASITDQQFPTNIPIALVSEGFTDAGYTGDKCVELDFTDFAGTQVDKFIARYDGTSHQYVTSTPSSKSIILPTY